MGAAAGARQRLHAPATPWEAREYSRMGAALRQALGEAEFGRLHAQGEAWGFEEALEAARAPLLEVRSG
jgi:hypothetical protein